MSGRHVPFSKRHDADAVAAHLEAMHEGVPSHLRESVIGFVDVMISDETQLRRAEVDIETRFERFPQWGSTKYVLRQRLEETQPLALDLVHSCLQRVTVGEIDAMRHVAQLSQALTAGGSAYEVAVEDLPDGCQRLGLQDRVPQAVRLAAESAMKLDRAGDHLTRAWNAAFGRDPSPGEAYAQAVKAVEVAARPILTPNDDTSTLGKMLGEYKANEASFETELVGAGDSGPGSKADVPGVAVARLMVQLLWTSQHDRHGNLNPAAPIEVSQDEAQAAVHLAVTLVQWFSTGVVRRT